VVENIYLDMDGVIADFDKSYRSIFGVNCRDDKKKKNWNTFVLNYRGFAYLEMMPDAQELLDFIFSTNKKISILSCASILETYTEVTSQKIEWLEKHNLGNLPRHFTFSKAGKSQFATPTSMLIDDSIECIEPFRNPYGIGILHINAANTINELRKLL
jgi:hypothetical protein